MPHLKANDLNTYYVERGDPMGEPIVFVHGNWVTSTEWEPVLDRLPSGYRAIAYDLRGRGQTEGPDNDYTMPEMAADLLGLVDGLGLDKFHLVSHSLGSAVAMEFTLEHPERVKSLTVLAPAWIDGMPEMFNMPAGQIAAKNDFNLYTMALKAQAPTLPDGEFWQRILAEGHKQGLEASLRNLPALVAWKPGDRLGEMGVPTLVMMGENDALTGGANGQRAADALHSELVVIPGVGHSPNMEAPDRFVELMMEHIEGRKTTDE